MTEGRVVRRKRHAPSQHSVYGPSMADPNEPLKQAPLHALHLELGAKMVPFSGYDMPVQYPVGVLKEPLHTREKAGLFDVSHMGQAFLSGDDPGKALEWLTQAAGAGM